MTGADQNHLLLEADFLDPRSQDLDERHALKMFLEKTPEQAERGVRTVTCSGINPRRDVDYFRR